MTQARITGPRLPAEGATINETTLRDLVSPLFRHRRLATFAFVAPSCARLRRRCCLSRKYESTNGDSGKSRTAGPGSDYRIHHATAPDGAASDRRGDQF